MRRIAGVLFVFLIFSLSPVAAQSPQYRRAAPAQEECPQAREIRAQKAYPSTMSDCEVLDADTAVENNRGSQRSSVPPAARTFDQEKISKLLDQDARKNSEAKEVDPYAKASRDEISRQYRDRRQIYIDTVGNAYFTFGCKVYSDEGGVARLLHEEYLMLLAGNEAFVAADSKLDQDTRERAKTALELSTRPNACDIYRNNSDLVVTLRRRLEAIR